MATVSAPDVLQNLTAYNYGICFLDLLGQRAVFRGEGWLPPASGDEEKKIFFEAKLKPTVGAVMALQRRAYNMIASVVEPRDDAPFRKQLAPEQRPVWDAMHRTKIKTQHWSDGLISYAALGDPDIKCRMNAMYGLFGMAGAAMLQGCAMRQPVRGAIDGAWAMEIRDGELYGPAIANAYELESTVSQWPRIVISDRILKMLTDHRDQPGDDVFIAMDRALAEMCMKMVARDLDGVPILHYLGDEFTNAITQAVLPDLYGPALTFIEDELARFRRTGDAKLALRYAQLRMYFKANEPKKVG